MTSEFSLLNGLLGGALIGLAAVFLMLSIGRIAGISGILGSTLKPATSASWQWGFILGLVAAGAITHWLVQPIQLDIESNSLWLIVSGLLVGLGTRLGSGCTSGHGVCGTARLSPRSLIATFTFVLVGVLTVYLIKLLTS